MSPLYHNMLQSVNIVYPFKRNSNATKRTVFSLHERAIFWSLGYKHTFGN